MIRVPQEIIPQLAAGEEITLSIERGGSAAEMTPDEAWEATLVFMEARRAKGKLPGAYKWRREETY